MALRIELSCRLPFAGRALLEFFATRAVEGLESVAGGVYRRHVSIGGARGWIEVAPPGSEGFVRVTSNLAPGCRDEIVLRVRRMFDLDARPRRVARVLGADPRLAAPVASYPGMRVPGGWDGFEIGVRAILGQQVTVRGATTLVSRLVRRYGELVEAGDGAASRLFPSPETLAAANLDNLGVPAARARTVGALARAVAEGRLVLDSTADAATARESLLALPGIGQWTAGYIAMRALGDRDAYPVGDLVLRRAASTSDDALSVRELERRSEAWRPWRAYATVYLWRSAADRAA